MGDGGWESGESGVKIVVGGWERVGEWGMLGGSKHGFALKL